MKIEKIMIVVSFILLGIMMVSASPFYYNFGLDYNKGDINIKSVNIEFYQDPNLVWNYFNDSSIYYLEIIDDGNNVLDKSFFSPQNFVIYDLVNETGNLTESQFVIFENASFEIFVDYYENAYQLVVYDEQGKELDRMFISQFSKTGFDERDFEDVRIEDREVEGDVEEEIDEFVEDENYKTYVIILIVILIILVIILIYLLRKKK